MVFICQICRGHTCHDQRKKEVALGIINVIHSFYRQGWPLPFSHTEAELKEILFPREPKRWYSSAVFICSALTDLALTFEEKISQPKIQKPWFTPNSVSCSSHSVPLEMPSLAFPSTYHHEKPTESEQVAHIWDLLAQIYDFPPDLPRHHMSLLSFSQAMVHVYMII